MAKSRKTKAKHQDFQKVKLKVGRRLPKGQNETRASFKSHCIQIKEQLKTDSSQPTTKRKLNLNDLLSSCQHYNSTMRHEALKGLHELLTTYPDLLHSHLSTILGRLCELFHDKDNAIRSTVHKLLRTILPQISADQISPFFPLFSAHLCCAMTHIQDNIQLDSLTILDLCLESFPSLVTGSTSQILPNFVEQISRGVQSGSGSERSLLVNPDSKVSSTKWRVKVLDRLHRFLQALSNRLPSTGSVCEWNYKQITCSEDKSVFVQPLSSSAMHFQDCNGFRLSQSADVTVGCTRGANTSGKELLTQPDELKKFSQTLVPLLLDCWLEVGPSQLATDLPGNALSGDGLSTLSSVLGVILLLLRYIHSVDVNTDTAAWVQQRFRQDFTQHFMIHFPFSMHERPVRKGKTSNEMVKAAQPSVLSLNLSVCEVMSYFLVDATGQMLPLPWFDQLATYVIGQLSAARLTTDQLQSLLRVLRRLVALPLKDDMLDSLLSAACDVTHGKHPSSADVRHLLEFFTELVLHSKGQDFLGFPRVSQIMESLPGILSKVLTSGGRSATAVTFLLRTLNALLVCRHQPMLDSLQINMSSLTAHLVTLHGVQQRSLAQLLYHVPTLDSKVLESLCHVSQQHSLEVSTVQYVIQVLHARYLRGKSQMKFADTTASYISFLISMLIGYSNKQICSLQSADRGQLCKGQWQFVVMEQTIKQWDCLHAKVKCTVNAFKQFSNTAQLWQVLDSFLVKFLHSHEMLPLHTAISVVYVASDLLTPGKPNQPQQNVSSELAISLARLLISVDTYLAVETEEQSAELVHHVTVHKHAVCVECLHQVPWVCRQVLLAVQQFVMTDCSTLESLQPYISMLTLHLQSKGLDSQHRQGKTLLEDIAGYVQVHFTDIETCEWWHSYKYLISLL